MFCRMTRIHFEETGFAELTAWAETARPRVEAINGLLFADLVRTGRGEGMVIAACGSEHDYEAAADTAAEVLGEMGEMLTGRPHIHAGSVAVSLRRQHRSPDAAGVADYSAGCFVASRDRV
jgi:hypothetical protein